MSLGDSLGRLPPDVLGHVAELALADAYRRTECPKALFREWSGSAAARRALARSGRLDALRAEWARLALGWKCDRIVARHALAICFAFGRLDAPPAPPAAVASMDEFVACAHPSDGRMIVMCIVFNGAYYVEYSAPAGADRGVIRGTVEGDEFRCRDALAKFPGEKGLHVFLSLAASVIGGRPFQCHYALIGEDEGTEAHCLLREAVKARLF